MMWPADHILQALRDDQNWFKDKSKKLEARKRFQVFIARLEFFARFVRHGRTFLHSSYAAFTGAHKLHCVQDLAMVTDKMFKNVRELERRVQTGCWTPIVPPALVCFPWSGRVHE